MASIQDTEKYKIMSTTTHFVLDILGGHPTNSARVICYDWHDGPNQVWEAHKASDTSFFFTTSAKPVPPAVVGKTFALDASAAQAGHVIVYAAHGKGNQQWILDPIKPNGFLFYIRNAKSNKVLQCNGERMEVTVAAKDSKNKNQWWSLQEIDDRVLLSTPMVVPPPVVIPTPVVVPPPVIVPPPVVDPVPTRSKRDAEVEPVEVIDEIFQIDEPMEMKLIEEVQICVLEGSSKFEETGYNLEAKGIEDLTSELDSLMIDDDNDGAIGCIGTDDLKSHPSLSQDGLSNTSETGYGKIENPLTIVEPVPNKIEDKPINGENHSKVKARSPSTSPPPHGKKNKKEHHHESHARFEWTEV